MVYKPKEGSYDYALGIEPEIIKYIRESHVVQSRISPTRCYLLHQNLEGEKVGSANSPLKVTSYSLTSPGYKAVIWSGIEEHPDLRLKTSEGEDPIKVFIDGIEASRVVAVEDLEEDNEYAIVQRKDLKIPLVEIVFNNDFDASSHEITYYYTSYQPGISDIRLKEGEDSTHSMFGWSQHIEYKCDDFQDEHQILVRLPLTIRDLTVNEEGLVVLEERNSWMIWKPYARDFDILIIAEEHSFTGKEERFEIVEKQDSVIQGSLVSQRFKLKHIEYTDKRYQIPYLT